MGVMIDRKKKRVRVLWNGLAQFEVVGIEKEASRWKLLFKEGGHTYTCNKHLVNVIEKYVEGGECE